MKPYHYKLNLGDLLITKCLITKSHIFCAEKIYGMFNTFEVKLIKTVIPGGCIEIEHWLNIE